MKEPFALDQEEMAHAVNLMAHPMAGMMALSAVGFGFASHAVGNWLGAVSAATEVSQRFWQPLLAQGGVSVWGEPSGFAAPGAEQAARLPETPAAAAASARQAATVLPLRKAARPVKAAKTRAETPTAPSSQPLEAPKPLRPDDLKVISGIGPKLEQVLNGLGVSTYAQIAAWDENDIARIEDFLGFKGRVERDGWIAQAAKLGGTAGGGEPQP